MDIMLDLEQLRAKRGAGSRHRCPNSRPPRDTNDDLEAAVGRPDGRSATRETRSSDFEVGVATTNGANSARQPRPTSKTS